MKKFYCSDITGYYHNVASISITRTGSDVVNDNYYDRLFTSYYALKKLYSSSLSNDEKKYLLSKFRNAFLMVTARHLLAKNQYSKVNAVIKAYCYCLSKLLSVRSLEKEVAISKGVFNSRYKDLRVHLNLKAFNLTSFSPESLEYFKVKRDVAWGREIVLPDLEVMPKKSYIFILVVTTQGLLQFSIV